MKSLAIFVLVSVCLCFFCGCGAGHGFVQAGNRVLIDYPDNNSVIVKNNIQSVVLTNFVVGGRPVGFSDGKGVIEPIKLTAGQEVSIALGYIGYYEERSVQVKADVYDESGKYLGFSLAEVPLRYSRDGRGYVYTEAVSRLCVFNTFKPVVEFPQRS